MNGVGMAFYPGVQIRNDLIHNGAGGKGGSRGCEGWCSGAKPSLVTSRHLIERLIIECIILV